MSVSAKILKDQKRVEEIVASLEALSGQKVVMTKARKAIAGFKIREGQEIGVRVTLHGKRMWDFLDRLLLVALPRVRDFQGLPKGVIDASGNANVGIREHAVFSGNRTGESRSSVRFSNQYRNDRQES
ncbi:MAG: 50S ribosomal protein L5 [Candidatus Moraniibacteriota bacterium]